MRLGTLTALLSGIAPALAVTRAAKVFIQPVQLDGPPPSFLAEVEYDLSAPAEAAVTSFEAPEIPDGAALVRVGVYDPKAAAWLSSTSVASAENFGRGYSPTIILSVDAKGDVGSAACRGVRVDAGQTRDFGPQAMVVVAGKGKHPELNKPVVLSPEGKTVVPEEKTLLQKYWWVIAIVLFVLMTGGGGDSK